MANLYTDIFGTGTDIGDISASGIYLVKPDYDNTTVTELTIPHDDVFIKFAGFGKLWDGASAYRKLNLTGARAKVEVGPGWMVGDIDFEGVDHHLKLHNGAQAGVLTGSAAADNLALEGGGWGAVVGGIIIAGDDCLCHSFRVNSKTPPIGSAAGNDGIRISGGAGRAKILFMNIEHSDAAGINLIDPSCLVYGCTLIASDSHGIILDAATQSVIANRILATSAGNAIEVTANGINSTILSNYVNGFTDSINIAAGGNNNAIASNRAPSGITNAGTGNVLTDNNTT